MHTRAAVLCGLALITAACGRIGFSADVSDADAPGRDSGLLVDANIDAKPGLFDGDVKPPEAGMPMSVVSNLPADAKGRVEGEQRFVEDGIIDTDDGCDYVVDQRGAPQLCVLDGGTVEIGAGATMRVTGSRALVLVALSRLICDGVLDLAGLGAESGAGAAPAAGSSAGQAGAPGGGSAVVGGSGGDGSSGGPATETEFGVPLIGGAPGGTNLGGVIVEILGGGGGGAVQLVSFGTVELRGGCVIDAGGAGGDGGTGVLGLEPGKGGAGGGGGGSILIEASSVEVTVGAVLVANGGGGGGGGGDLGGLGGASGEGGTDGLRGVEPAPGGAGRGTGGDGGSGGSVDAEPTAGGGSSIQGGAGGGGGSQGRIVIRTIDPFDATGATISPAPTLRTGG